MPYVGFHYIDPDIGDESRHDPFKEADFRVQQRVFTILMKLYPTSWKAFIPETSHRAGIVRITLPHIAGADVGFTIPMQHMGTHNDFERMIRYATGEMIERYKIPPGINGMLEMGWKALQEPIYGRLIPA
jgi:hypothetical protein